MILLEAVVQVLVRPMPHTLAELCPDRPGICVVAVSRDPVRRYAGDRLCGSEEGLGRGEITMLAQHHVDQGTVAINRAIQVLPTAMHSGICLVDVPTRAHFAPSPAAKFVCQCRRELGFGWRDL